jgi:hypothetical protein
MTKRQEYRFKIDAFTPDTIPMARLAEYMADLATLLGSQEHVHFVRLEPGSTVVVQEVEYEAIPKVRERLIGVKSRSAPEDASRAYSNIDRRLAEDNATGVIETSATNVIEFPGRNRGQLEVFGPVTQQGSLDGVLIRVGGKDATVPVYLQEDEIVHKCNSNRETAKKLAPYLYGTMLRVHGVGRWNRDDFGNWVMDRFNITDFTPLDETSLTDVVSKLRSISGGVQSEQDPVEKLRRIRHGTDKLQ